MKKVIITVFIIWRLILFFDAYLTSFFLPFRPRFPYSDVLLIPSKLPFWIWSFANFDGVHYLTIAKNGYSAQFTQVFFPLYPFIIGFISNIFPFLNEIVIGLSISNISFILFIYYFIRLLKIDYKSSQIIWILLFLIFFPTSFYFGSLYTESLFMALIISGFYYARINRWWLAGILGALASATRPLGIILLPALIWEWQKEKFKVQSSLPANATHQALQAGKIKEIDQTTKYKYYISLLHCYIVTLLNSPLLYLVPLGLIVYMIYLQLTFSDALMFWHVQPIFGAERSGNSVILLPQVFWRYLKILISVGFQHIGFWIALWELFFTFFAIYLLLLAHKLKIRTSYLIFSWVSILIPTITGTLSSMPRYILTAFPLFIVLGVNSGKYMKSVLLIISIILMLIFTALFTHGYWVA